MVEREVTTTHLITLDKIKVFHLSKAELLDCLRLDNPGDMFEVLPCGRSRWRSDFQVSRLDFCHLGQQGSLPARWACHASSGWFLPAPCGSSTTIGVENCTVQQQTGQVESLGRVTWGDHNLGTTCGDHNTKVNQKVSAREIGRARIFLGKADIFNQQ